MLTSVLSSWSCVCVCVWCAGLWAVATAPQMAPKARTFEHRRRGKSAEVLLDKHHGVVLLEERVVVASLKEEAPAFLHADTRSVVPAAPL